MLMHRSISGYLAGALCVAILSGCSSSDAGSDTASRTVAPSETGIADNAVPGEPIDQHGWQNVGNTVFFETDSYILTADAQSQLQQQAEWLKAFPARTFTIEGHADERGTREYNLGLGERRANAIGSYFVALGIDKSRISVISYGKERPLCVEANEECWGQNRRGVSSLNQ